MKMHPGVQTKSIGGVTVILGRQEKRGNQLYLVRIYTAITNLGPTEKKNTLFPQFLTFFEDISISGPTFSPSGPTFEKY